MTTKLKINLLTSVSVLLTAFGIRALHIAAVHADDTPSQTIQKSADDASNSAKKTTRKAKKNMRKATGTDNVAKDAKDKAADVGDDVSNTAKKAKVDAQ
jgi:hypothetical protein